ncbi:MAG TPA: class II aldolase/adducin family protein [Burkholderiaceae bacterium]|nr:class II aldolase/adducin family protein [Burkholderiaceae bacterium]
MTTASRATCENDARQALIDAACSMNALRINHGKAGNVSMRWPRSAADGMLITPSAIPYERLSIDDVVWLPLADSAAAPAAIAAPDGLRSAPLDTDSPPQVDGPRRPSFEWRFHRDIYRARAATGAIVHAHASYCTSLACLPAVQQHGIPAFHYMIAAAGGDSIRCARYATFGTQQLSDAALQALADRDACLLAHHGMIAIGADLAAALELAVEVEALARMYWQVLQLGEPATLDAAEMRRVLERFARYRDPQA